MNRFGHNSNSPANAMLPVSAHALCAFTLLIVYTHTQSQRAGLKVDKPNEGPQSASPLSSRRPSQMRRSIEGPSGAANRQQQQRGEAALSGSVGDDDAESTAARNGGGDGGRDDCGGRQRSLTFSRYDLDGPDEDAEGAGGWCCPRTDYFLGVKVSSLFPLNRLFCTR